MNAAQRMTPAHEWFTIAYSYATFVECECGFRPSSQEEMDAHIPRTTGRENRDHGPDWSDWGIDHPEEGPSCKCGYNGTPEECATDRRENGSADQ